MGPAVTFERRFENRYRNAHVESSRHDDPDLGPCPLLQIMIEKRKEEQELMLLEQEKEEERRKAQLAREAEAAEDKRRREDAARREKEVSDFTSAALL